MNGYKRFFSVLLCIVLMLGMFSFPASADSMEQFYAKYSFFDRGTKFEITVTLTPIFETDSVPALVNEFTPFVRVTRDEETVGDYSFSVSDATADSVSLTLSFSEGGSYRFQVFNTGYGFEVEDGYAQTEDGYRVPTMASYEFTPDEAAPTPSEYPFHGIAKISETELSIELSGANGESNTELSALLNEYQPYVELWIFDAAGNEDTTQTYFPACRNGVSTLKLDISGYSSIAAYVYSDVIGYFAAVLSVYDGDTLIYEGEMIDYTAGGYPPSVVFDDVPDDWYAEYVYFAVDLGLINGLGDNKFGPEESLSCAQALTLACKMHYLMHTYENPDSYFDITGCDPWYQPYIDYAKENGIPWYFSDYNAPITRREYVHVFHAALSDEFMEEINEVAPGVIPDVSMTSPYASEIYDFYRMGICNGSDAQGTFNPNSNIRRCEVAAIVCRMVEPYFRVPVELG